jgi:hypothetical protein
VVKKYKELIDILKPFGIRVIEKRGKGSERMLYQDATHLNYPIKYHKKTKNIIREFYPLLKENLIYQMMCLPNPTK